MKSGFMSRGLKLSGGVVGLIALLAILVAANVLVSTLRCRVDITEEKIYTLSDGTRQVLKKLDAPVTLKFFFNSTSAEIPMPLKSFARQIEDLLQEYQLASGGQVILECYDPKPDSDAEEWAEQYGLAGTPMDGGMGGGAKLYLGLVAVKGDESAVIPFFDPRTEELLEYNITRMIARIANPKKPAVGVMSSLPVMGVQSFPYAMPGQPPPKSQPPWATFRNLSEEYDVRQVGMDVEVIPPDLDALILAHPKNLSDKTLYAIDQYLLKGGRLLAFVDPFCVSDAQNAQGNPMMGMPPKPASDLGRLTAAWGVTYDADKVLADLGLSTRIRRSETSVEDSPVFITLRQENIDGKDIVTSTLKSMTFPLAGSFSGNGIEGVKVGSLLVSSEESALVGSMIAQMGAQAVRRDFKSDMKRQALAMRLTGTFKTAFPSGKPACSDPTKDGDKPPEPVKDDAPWLKESVKPSTVILVADVDMLNDPFTVQEMPFLGQRVVQPVNDNIAFFANAVDQLAGSSDLIGIRSRGRIDRPFDKVLALQRQAQERWLVQEQTLQQKLESTQQRLDTLQSQKDKSQKYILSPEQEREIGSFREEQVRTQRDLKQVRKNLREGIESLGRIVKTANIVTIPVLVVFAGLLFGGYRRLKTKSA